MNSTYIFLPVIVMVAVTLLITLKLGKARIRAVTEGRVSHKAFLTNQGYDLPDDLAKLERHYNNLLEMPVLFYLWAVVLFITDKVDLVGIVFAWIYVALRLFHTYIHTGSNILMKRRNLFIYSYLVLSAAWVWLVLKLYVLG